MSIVARGLGIGSSEILVTAGLGITSMVVPQPPVQQPFGGGRASGRGRRRRIYLPDIEERQEDDLPLPAFRLPAVVEELPGRRSKRRRRAEELLIIALNTRKH